MVKGKKPVSGAGTQKVQGEGHHEAGDVSGVWGLAKPEFEAGFFFKGSGEFYGEQAKGLIDAF